MFGLDFLELNKSSFCSVCWCGWVGGLSENSVEEFEKVKDGLKLISLMTWVICHNEILQ